MNISAKPKALAFVSPFEGARGYFLAGLSHFYRLDVYYNVSRRFRFKWQIFHKWAYASDVRFFKYDCLNELLNAPAGYDAVFIHPNALTPFFGWYENQQEMTEFVLLMKEKGKKIYWLDMGENQYHVTSNGQFWDNIDACLKGQVFKKEYEPIFFDKQKVALFQGKDVMENPVIVADNMQFNFEKYRHKILPCPYVPSITKPKDLNFFNQPKIYDIAANTRTYSNGLLRYRLIKEIQKKLDKKYIYSFDYDDKGWETNLPKSQQPFDPYLIKTAKVGKLWFKLKYGAYFYPQALYLHNLARAKCFFAPAWCLLSFRNADCWGAGCVLINFSAKKFNYGLPMEDGVNYVSIGERDEMTDDNESIKPEFIPGIVSKVEELLGNQKKQEEIIKNGKIIFNEYYSSPNKFVKKVFIDKVLLSKLKCN